MTVALEIEEAQGQLELSGPTQTSMRPERKLSDAFWMYTYKVDICPKKEFHDWEKCAYAHPGERARRRHPSKYQAVQCPEARAKKVCPRGMDCPCTHHLFEYWLHPDRYLTCLCELGPACNRPICFFAHTEDELRPLPPGLSVAAPPPAPAPSKQQQHRNPAARHSSSQTPLNSLVPDLVASFNYGLAVRDGSSEGASQAVSSPTCDTAGPSLAASASKGRSSSSDNMAAAAPGSGAQQLIDQMARAGTGSSGSTAFSALDDLAGGPEGNQLTAITGAASGPCSNPLAVVVVAPNPSEVVRSNSGRISSSPNAPLAAGQVLLHPHPQQQQQQQFNRPGWQAPYLAVPPISAGGSGFLPGMQPSAQVLQSQLQQLQQQGLLHQGSGASTSCSSPLGLVSSSPIGFGMGTSSTAAASPRSMTSGLDVFDMHSSHGVGGPRVLTSALSPGRLSPGILSPQNHVTHQPGGAAGYALLSMPMGNPMVNPQQVMPVQVYDEPPAEHLSFSLWGGDGNPGVPQQHLLHQHQSKPLLVQHQQRQQQQMFLLQQRQQLLQQQQQILEQQYQLQQLQQAAPASSAPMMAPYGGFGGVQQPLTHGLHSVTHGFNPLNHVLGPAARLTGAQQMNAAGFAGNQPPVSSGFSGFQALDMLPQQQQSQQALLMSQLQQQQQLQQP